MRRWLKWIQRLGWRRSVAILWLLVLLVAAIRSCLLPDRNLTPDLLNSNAPPFTSGHWLGTDPLGQDVWTLLLYGARTALLVSLPTAGLAIGLGSGLGLVAGYWSDTRLRFALSYWLTGACSATAYILFQASNTAAMVWWPLVLLAAALLLGKVLSGIPYLRRQLAVPIDKILLAAITLLAALPRLLLVLAVAAAFEPSLLGLVALLTFTSWTQPARLVRAEVIRVSQLPYLEAAHTAGLPAWRIIGYHLLPNAWGPIITTLPLSIAVFITLETTLSFLGVGLPPETPSWGRLLALARLAPSSWWLFVFPGFCLLATALSLRQLLSSGRQRNAR